MYAILLIAYRAGEKRMDLSRLYHPLTATPFQNDLLYREAAPSHALLRPWIRCLWGGVPRTGPDAGAVIPDTCSDIILRIGRQSGRITADYCALNDRPFFSSCPPDQTVELFAVRFYPWAACLFAQDSLRDSLNRLYDARQHFPALVRALTRIVLETDSFDERCIRAEEALLSLLSGVHIRPEWMNAMAELVQNEGRLRMSELALRNQLSTRQLERLFLEHTGASPKKLSDLIRYQCVWRDAVTSPRFDVQDAVERYGYADQSHLLRHFRRFHASTLSQAVASARVGFVLSGGPCP